MKTKKIDTTEDFLLLQIDLWIIHNPKQYMIMSLEVLVRYQIKEI